MSITYLPNLTHLFCFHLYLLFLLSLYLYSFFKLYIYFCLFFSIALHIFYLLSILHHPFSFTGSLWRQQCKSLSGSTGTAVPLPSPAQPALWRTQATSEWPYCRQKAKFTVGTGSGLHQTRYSHTYNICIRMSITGKRKNNYLKVTMWYFISYLWPVYTWCSDFFVVCLATCHDGW